MQENVVWFVGAMIEQTSDENIIKIFYEYDIVEKIVVLLEYKNERVRHYC